MTEAQACRDRAERDLDAAAAADLETVRFRYLRSAAVWLARAEMFERTGLRALTEDEAA